MLGLTAQMGDVAIRTDLNKTFILAGEDASSLDSWKEMLTPTDIVLSVNGKTGAVVLAVADIEGAAPKENPTFTGTVIVPKPGADDNSEKAASTSWIREFITALTGSSQPKELGSASAGSSNKFSREDHVQPLPTVIDGGTF